MHFRLFAYKQLSIQTITEFLLSHVITNHNDSMPYNQQAKLLLQQLTGVSSFYTKLQDEINNEISKKYSIQSDMSTITY